MNLDDIKGAAQGMLGGMQEKAAGLTGGMGAGLFKDEEKTDAALDAIAGAAKKVVPGMSDKVDAARDALDAKLGTE